MKKILLSVCLILSQVAISYASQDRNQFVIYGYTTLLDRRTIEGMIRTLESSQEVVAGVIEDVAQRIAYVPYKIAEIVDTTMPSYDKSIYAYLAKKDSK